MTEPAAPFTPLTDTEKEAFSLILESATDGHRIVLVRALYRNRNVAVVTGITPVDESDESDLMLVPLAVIVDEEMMAELVPHIEDTPA